MLITNKDNWKTGSGAGMISGSVCGVNFHMFSFRDGGTVVTFYVELNGNTYCFHDNHCGGIKGAFKAVKMFKAGKWDFLGFRLVTSTVYNVRMVI